ncbi:hypothetical protein B0H14DRAFT_2619542 [Mycena olivaceomarginata]|nr:hypothetical protein B0H14DRAFT_2619542 [Mycena olivaceomarginata]
MSNSNQSVDSKPHRPKSTSDKKARNAHAAATYRAKQKSRGYMREGETQDAAVNSIFLPGQPNLLPVAEQRFASLNRWFEKQLKKEGKAMPTTKTFAILRTTYLLELTWVMCERKKMENSSALQTTTSIRTSNGGIVDEVGLFSSRMYALQHAPQGLPTLSCHMTREDLKLQRPAHLHPDLPDASSWVQFAGRSTRNLPCVQLASRSNRTPAREEIVADREDNPKMRIGFAESNADAHPHTTPDLSNPRPLPRSLSDPVAPPHAPPKRMPAVKSDMRRPTTPTIAPSSPAARGHPKTKTEAPTPKIKIKTEAPVPDIKVEAPTPALKTGPRTRPLIASSNTRKHDVTAEAPTPILKTGPRTRPLIASSNVRSMTPGPRCLHLPSRPGHSAPLIVSSKAYEPDMGEPRAERKSTRMHLAKSEGWAHTQREFGQAVTHAHALHVNRPAPLLESDEEDLAAGKESALPTRTLLQPPVQSQEDDQPGNDTAGGHDRLRLCTNVPGHQHDLTLRELGLFPQPIVFLTTAVSVQAGKRQKLVMLPAAHTESASAPLAAASSSRPRHFRESEHSSDLQKLSVVPMDLEEAHKG